jgi:hypothetical protein
VTLALHIQIMCIGRLTEERSEVGIRFRTRKVRWKRTSSFKPRLVGSGNVAPALRKFGPEFEGVGTRHVAFISIRLSVGVRYYRTPEFTRPEDIEIYK